MGDNFKRTTALVGQLGDFVTRGVALHLDGSHDAITNGVYDWVAGFVCTFGIGQAAILHQISENGL